MSDQEYCILIVEGMQSSEIAEKIHQAVSQLPYCLSVFTSLETTSIKIYFDNKLSSYQVFSKSCMNIIESLGWKCKLITDLKPQIELKIEGMMCQNNCATTVQNAILSVNFVLWAEVSYKHGNAKIWANMKSVDVKSLIDIIDMVGYDASLKDASDSSSHSSSKKSRNSSSSSSDASQLLRTKKSTLRIQLEILNTSMMEVLESHLRKIDGIHKIKFLLLTSELNIQFEEQKITSDEICLAIEDTGYSGEIIASIVDNSEIREVDLSISGMSCANCATKIEKLLKKQCGVISVNISSITNKGRVILDEEVEDCIGLRDIVELVESLGFDCIASDDNQNHESETNSEVIIWTRLLIIALVFGIPLTMIHFLMQFKVIMNLMMIPKFCHQSLNVGQMILFVLSTPIQVFVGYRFYRASFIGAMNLNFGMDFLVVTGTSITYGYSLLQIIYGCSMSMQIKHTFFEASGMLLMFVTIGKYIEAYCKGKSSSAIAELLQLQPNKALLVKHDSIKSKMIFPYENELIQEIELKFIKKDDILKVLPGGRIPTDGIVISGISCVDESMITGEATPVMKKKDDLVYGSTMNHHSILYMRVTSIGSDNALSQIVKLVESAQLNKAPIQAYADEIASYFTPVVILLSLMTFGIWLTLSLSHTIPSSWFEEEYGNPYLFSMLFSISVVVISCPCALGLATPTAIMVGTSIGAKNGILIKGGPAFEMAHKITTIIFDKTGTLTQGIPMITNEIVLDEIFSIFKLSKNDTNSLILKDKLICIAASIEINSEHPLAKAIVNEAKKRNISLLPMEENSFKGITGNGIECILIDTNTNESIKYYVCIGNRQYMERNGILIGSTIDTSMWNLEIQGKTAICIAINNKIIGILGIADTLKPEACSSIEGLQTMGIEVYMVTGDNRTTAHAIAEELNLPLDHVFASALPQDKVSIIKDLQEKGKYVAMIGDGINDSPALAIANLGIAIGAGSQIAIETADMVLIRNNLIDILVALDLARVVFKKVNLNFIWATIYNIVAIPVAAGVLFPFTHSLLPPQYAGMSMALSSISVVLSSMSLRWYKKPSHILDILSNSDKIMETSNILIPIKSLTKEQYAKVPLQDNDFNEESQIELV